MSTLERPSAIEQLAYGYRLHVDALARMAYTWYRHANAIDPEYPNYDESITDSGEVQESRGIAAGLRGAAVELLTLIGRGKECTKCGKRIGDPTLPDDEGERCRECADPG